METKRLAEILNGREYRDHDVTPEHEQVAKAENMVIITGYSDDNIEMRGAISDEVGAYDGKDFHIDHKGNILEAWDDFQQDFEADFIGDTGRVLNELYKNYLLENTINVSGKFDHEGYSWYIDLIEPKEGLEYSYFDLMEDGEKHTRGIVVKLKK